MVRFAVVICALLASAMAQDEVAAELRPQRSFLEDHCLDCHGGDLRKGDLDLRESLADPVQRLARLSHLRARVAAAEMPPPDPDEPEGAGPDGAERVAFVAWADEVLWRDVPRLPPAPGRTTIRRLNGAQWRRTIEDLFGVTVATTGFPADDLGYGFDTVGEAMMFSTLHLEKYLAAASAVAAEVITGEDPEHPQVRRFEAETMRVGNPDLVTFGSDFVNLFSQTHLDQPLRLPRDGVYVLRVSARSTPAGTEAARMRMAIDGEAVATVEVPLRRFEEFETELRLRGGEHLIRLAYINDHYDPKNPDPTRRDRNLHIDWCELIGPIDAPVVPAQQRWVHEAAATGGSDPTRIRAFAAVLLPRVWRRPVEDDEIERHAGVGDAALADGEDLVAALRLVLQSALTSPNFLFRCEPASGTAVPGEAVPVTGSTLAVRLSYFLWASTPDLRLLELGRDDALVQRDVLLAEARRMLADPRADALATEFAAQWFELKNLPALAPDPDRFPGFDNELRHSLRAQTELLFRTVLRERRDVRDLLDCDFTHVDCRLAEFYGIPLPAGADGSEPVRVELPTGHARGGLLGHGSILAVTSNPTRTSPVKRGKWILENLLDAAPPPPPPGNGTLPDEAAAVESAQSFREQLAQHRGRRACAGCHVRMDTLGLALERFDAIGRRRDRDGGGEIDATGRLPDGRVVDGLAGLRQVLRADPAFVRTFARKLFVYGIGRLPRPIDALRLDHAVTALLRNEKVTVEDLVLAIIDSDAFRLRPAEVVR
ncbi:MAG: DUF1592 domain-containing protein [Planctomycetes bacterium]|nr:DUF1592 domain-containing protein [Planctomycetota bacterium]